MGGAQNLCMFTFQYYNILLLQILPFVPVNCTGTQSGSVKASHFMLLKRYQYLLIQTHDLNWIVEFSVEVGVN